MTDTKADALRDLDYLSCACTVLTRCPDEKTCDGAKARLIAYIEQRDAEIADLRGKAACYGAGLDEHAVYESTMASANAEIARLTRRLGDAAREGCPDCEGVYSLRLEAAERVCEAARELPTKGARLYAALAAWQSVKEEK